MACRTRCATQPPNCPRPVFNNARKNITVSYNLCANQDVLGWAYRAENNCTNSYGFYHLNATNTGVENLAVTEFLDPSTCMPCSCDSVLFFPELNLCSKVSIVLYTQKHTSNLGATQNVNSQVPGTTTCYVNLSERATYQVWKAVLCAPVQCAQKVEFHLVAEVHTSSIPSEDDADSRIENVLLEHLLH